MNYKIGQYVEVECRIKSNFLFSEDAYEKYVVKGVVVKTPSWVEYPAVAIRKEKEKFSATDLAIISHRLIVGYKEPEVEYETRAYSVGKYLVTKTNNMLHCTCVGFQFRRYCKHSDPYK